MSSRISTKLWVGVTVVCASFALLLVALVFYRDKGATEAPLTKVPPAKVVPTADAGARAEISVTLLPEGPVAEAGTALADRKEPPAPPPLNKWDELSGTEWVGAATSKGPEMVQFKRLVYEERLRPPGPDGKPQRLKPPYDMKFRASTDGGEVIEGGCDFYVDDDGKDAEAYCKHHPAGDVDETKVVVTRRALLQTSLEGEKRRVLLVTAEGDQVFYGFFRNAK